MEFNTYKVNCKINLKYFVCFREVNKRNLGIFFVRKIVKYTI